VMLAQQRDPPRRPAFFEDCRLRVHDGHASRGKPVRRGRSRKPARTPSPRSGRPGGSGGSKTQTGSPAAPDSSADAEPSPTTIRLQAARPSIACAQIVLILRFFVRLRPDRRLMIERPQRARFINNGL
jgi:hypothetical protein